MPNTGFTVNGADLDKNLVSKSYLMDRYPELANTFKTAGLWMWGLNDLGQLGDNTTIRKSSPVQTVAGGSNWKEVSRLRAGDGPSVGIKTDGTLWVWGKNNYGQLSDNTTTNRSSPIQTIAGGTNWKQVSAGHLNCGAIKTDGTLWVWGKNIDGSLGDNTTTAKSSPVQTVAGGNNWKQLSMGYIITGAIKTDGTLWMWGAGNNGALGDNTRTNKFSPVQTIAAGTNWKQISCGVVFTGAIKTDGTLWTWGRNGYGQLGDNTRTDKSSPIQTIAGGTNWKQVSIASNDSAAAIKTDGSLWLWGRNNLGQLGDNTTSSKSSPVQTIAGGTNWKQVSIGSGPCAAIKTDGTLWTWGGNSYGALGDGTTTGRSSPVQTIAGGTNWKQVSAGYHTMAIRDDSADFGIGTL
jgi:alpha-tubulin suppressor-like RCC1 family protein